MHHIYVAQKRAVREVLSLSGGHLGYYPDAGCHLPSNNEEKAFPCSTSPYQLLHVYYLRGYFVC